MKRLVSSAATCAILLAFITASFGQSTPSLVTMHNAATATGNGTELVIGQSAAVPSANLGAVGIQITGTFSGTVTFEASSDGTNWTPIMATNLADDARATTATAAGHYTMLYGSAIRVRARISAYSSGTITVKGRLIPGLTARVTSGGGGGGGVTSVAQSFTGGLISVGGSPITTSGTLALTVAGTSGGIPYFSSASTWASSAALAANALVIGGGAGAAPSTTTTGTGVLTALGVNVGSAGAFVTFNGAGGTPSSLTLTNATGLPPTTGISGWPANASGVLTNNGAGVLSWAAAGGGITIGTTTITSGTNTRVLYNNAGVVGEYTVTGTGNAVLSASPTLTGTLTAALATFAGSARSSGAASYFAIQTPADTGQTASTESIGMQFGGNSSAATVTRQWATGALTTQRENVFVAPTYAFVGASTLTTAATVAITGAPTAGTNATITSSRALLVQSGDVQILSGLLWFAGAASNQGGLREWNVGGEVGGVAAFQGSNSLLSGSIVGAGFYTNQFANNNSSITIAINRTNGVVLGSDLQFAWQSATSGGTSPTKDTGLARVAASVTRFTNGSTGAGSLVLGTSTVGSIGTSGVGVLAIANGTAPTSSPADEFQLYSADSAAGDANAFARNEAGEINRLTGLSARVSTQFDKTSDTTLANVTGLSRNVEAGRTYAFTAVLYTTSNVAGGVKAAIGGTATATSIIYQAEVLDGSTLATMGTARATSLATTVGDVTAVTAARITISGTIVVNAAGTLTVQFAQNASNGSASSVLVNSSFQLIPIS